MTTRGGFIRNQTIRTFSNSKDAVVISTFPSPRLNSYRPTELCGFARTSQEHEFISILVAAD